MLNAKSATTSFERGGTSRTVLKSPFIRNTGGKPPLKWTSEAPSWRAAWSTRSRTAFILVAPFLVPLGDELESAGDSSGPCLPPIVSGGERANFDVLEALS
jgi:hypothetical protein